MIYLKELRLEVGLTRAELARALKINQGTLANYENGIREANHAMLCLFADFFDVTVDYLLGREGEPLKVFEKPYNKIERQLIQSFRTLDEDKQKALINFLDTISK